MKFLVCGLGSIGQRHVRMLRRVMGDDCEIAAYRSRKLDIVITDTMEATAGVPPEEHYGLEAFDDLRKALAWKPDAVFVTNPISLHVPVALEAAREGCHLFIEKPLSDTLDGVEELAALVQSKKLVCMVGYQMRFHPALIQVRKWLREGRIGRVIAADVHFGEWLPGMHPYEDYRKSHAARLDQGGGVIRCLSHDVDYPLWLFGPPVDLFATGGHLSDLEMDVEDTADIIMRCHREGRLVPVHIHLDFLQRPARRECRIVGDRGFIHWDYPASSMQIAHTASGRVENIEFEGFERNDMFVDEVSHFVDCIRRGSRPSISLDDGILVMKVCLAALQSMKHGRVETLDP